MFTAMKFTILALLVPPLLLNSCDDDRSNVSLGVLARERVALTATANEIVTDLPVAEGEMVKAGTILVQLDDTLGKANLAVAMANLSQAEADLDKTRRGARQEEIAIAESRVDGARAVHREAESTVARNTTLLERGAITQSRLDQDIARLNAAQADLRSAEQSLLEMTAGAREEDVRIAAARLEAARAVVAVEQTRLDNLTIRASRDGVLDNLPWNLGERVPQGSPVAIILADARPFARVYIPEPSRAGLKKGDPIRVGLDGLDTVFEGKLRWISEDPAFTPYYALNQEQRSRLVYLAEIDLPPEADGLPAGIPVMAFLP